jgi:hypothetical protein
LIDVFTTIHQGRDGDEIYNYWDRSLIKVVRPTKIPFTLLDEKDKSALEDSPWGLQNFYPWFVSGFNSGANDQFVRIMAKLLTYNDKLLKAHKYWFLRGDCNIFKFWMKVCVQHLLR